MLYQPPATIYIPSVGAFNYFNNFIDYTEYVISYFIYCYNKFRKYRILSINKPTGFMEKTQYGLPLSAVTSGRTLWMNYLNMCFFPINYHSIQYLIESSIIWIIHHSNPFTPVALHVFNCIESKATATGIGPTLSKLQLHRFCFSIYCFVFNTHWRRNVLSLVPDSEVTPFWMWNNNGALCT